MTQKTIDATFVQYGIRADDLQVIESLAIKHDLDVEKIKEMLREFHDKRIKQEDFDDTRIRRFLETHVNKLSQ